MRRGHRLLLFGIQGVLDFLSAFHEGLFLLSQGRDFRLDCSRLTIGIGGEAHYHDQPDQGNKENDCGYCPGQ
jgi:hypothetical protein